MVGRRWWVPSACAVVALLVPSTAACSKPEPPPAPAPETVAHGVVITPTGIVAPILSTFDGGWWVRTPCFGVGLVLADEDEVTRIDHATVVLDPGHGGTESGAVGPNGLPEKEVNLDVSQQVAQQLRDAGVEVALTRTGDASFVTLRTRAEIATALAPEAFVAIHHNSSDQPRSDVPGTESYFQMGSADGERLARLLHEDVLAAIAPFDVDWVRPGDAGAKYRQGDDGDYYGILRYSKPVTGVIVEASFISNPAEADWLRTPEARRAEADGITSAIRDYLDGGATGPDVITTAVPASSTTTVPASAEGAPPAGPPPSEPPVTLPGTLPVYAPAADAGDCTEPPLY